MRHVLTVILIFILATLQTTVLRGLELFHVIPNLLYVFVVCYCLTKHDYSALIYAVFCGLILDFLGGRPIGMHALMCTLAAYFCLAISGNLFNNNLFVAMVFVFVLSVPYEFFTYLFYFVIWGRGSWGYAVFCKILPISVYNFLFTMVLYPVIKLIAGESAQSN